MYIHNMISWLHLHTIDSIYIYIYNMFHDYICTRVCAYPSVCMCYCDLQIIETGTTIFNGFQYQFTTCKIIETGRTVFNGFQYQFTTRKPLKTFAPVSIILQVAVSECRIKRSICLCAQSNVYVYVKRCMCLHAHGLDANARYTNTRIHFLNVLALRV